MAVSMPAPTSSNDACESPLKSDSKSIRVLHVYAGNLYGGIEKVLLTFASQRHLCPELETEFALCFEGRLSSELRATGVPVHMVGRVRLSRPWTTMRARGRLQNLLNSGRYDVVITHSAWLHAAFAPAIRRTGVPLWFWARDSYKILHPIERMAARTRPDYILANSKFTMSAVAHLFPGIAGEVLYNPLSPMPPIDRVAARAGVRDALQCPPQTTVIFMGSRLEKWKGHDLLLQALALLKDDDWQAWIAGGPQRPHEQRHYIILQAMAHRLGVAEKVRWLGHRKEIPALLVAADIHCQPNTGPEPFGNVFIEALQAGLPVVTTRLGAAPEVVDETCGVLTEPGDPQSLANALHQLMSPQSRELLVGGPRRAKALCDPAQQLSGLHNAIHRVVAKDR